jgi:hypothetical protein
MVESDRVGDLFVEALRARRGRLAPGIGSLGRPLFSTTKLPRRFSCEQFRSVARSSSVAAAALGRNAVPPIETQAAQNERHRSRACDRDSILGVRFYADRGDHWRHVPLRPSRSAREGRRFRCGNERLGLGFNLEVGRGRRELRPPCWSSH